MGAHFEAQVFNLYLYHLLNNSSSRKIFRSYSQIIFIEHRWAQNCPRRDISPKPILFSICPSANGTTILQSLGFGIILLFSSCLSSCLIVSHTYFMPFLPFLNFNILVQNHDFNSSPSNQSSIQSLRYHDLQRFSQFNILCFLNMSSNHKPFQTHAPMNLCTVTITGLQRCFLFLQLLTPSFC